MKPDIAGDTALRIPAQWVRWALEAGGDPFNIEQARRLAVELMAGHGVSDWALRIGGAKAQAGSLRYRLAGGAWDGRPGTLTLSGPLMSLWNEEQRRETILHEIAHIKCPGSGHDHVWRGYARMVGAKPSTLWGEDGEKRIDGRWEGTCPAGHHQGFRLRKPRIPWSCTRCHPGGFDDRYVITWTRGAG